MSADKIINQAGLALIDLVGMIPRADRRLAEDSIDVLNNALSLLSEALHFGREVENRAERLALSANIYAERHSQKENL